MRSERSCYAISNGRLPELLHDINATLTDSPNVKVIGVCCDPLGRFFAVLEEEHWIDDESGGGPIASKS